MFSAPSTENGHGHRRDCRVSSAPISTWATGTACGCGGAGASASAAASRYRVTFELQADRYRQGTDVALFFGIRGGSWLAPVVGLGLGTLAAIGS